MFQGLLKLHVAAQASDKEAAMMVNRVLSNEILSAAVSAYPRDALPDQFIGEYDLDEVAGIQDVLLYVDSRVAPFGSARGVSRIDTSM
jgi:hypothetical protein